MIVGHQRKLRLTAGERHQSPVYEHWHTRGHQAHLDVTEHTDPKVLIRVDFEVSTDGGATWTFGGGFTRRGGNPRMVPRLNASRIHEQDEDGAPVFDHVMNARNQPIYEPGVPLDKYGQPLRYVTCHFGHELPHPDQALHREAAARRLVRAHVTVEGGDVATRLHVVGTPGACHDKALIPPD